MFSIRLLFILSIALLSLAEKQAEHKENDIFKLDEVVRWLPEESVKAALRDHLSPKYRDGVFEHGKKAIESIHNVDPLLATRLVDEALHRELEKQDLRKRQSNDSSTTTTPSGQSFLSLTVVMVLGAFRRSLRCHVS